MALTLPYPSLSFVPLDVLTAEEMNEIVANYTYIANQFPIGSANIASSAVTSSKIDWTTIKYSTNTEEPIGVWIDGKTIYRKVVDFGSLPNATGKNVNSGITNMAFLVRMTALAYNGSGTYLSIPYTHNNRLELQIQFAYTNNQIQISTGENRSSYSAYVILEYTKTS